jgi:hypothetical protein
MRVPKVLPTIIELISKLKIRRYLSISCKNELKPEIFSLFSSIYNVSCNENGYGRVGIIQYGLWPSPEVFVIFLSTKRVKLILFKELLLKAKS